MVRRRRPIGHPGPIIDAIRSFRRDVILSRISAKVPPNSEQYRKATAVNAALCDLADALSGETGTLDAPAHRNPEVG